MSKRQGYAGVRNQNPVRQLSHSTELTHCREHKASDKSQPSHKVVEQHARLSSDEHQKVVAILICLKRGCHLKDIPFCEELAIENSTERRLVTTKEDNAKYLASLQLESTSYPCVFRR